MSFLKKIPLPLAGVSLAFVGLGLLLEMYGFHCRGTLGILSAVVLVLPLLSLICDPAKIKSTLLDPVMASVSGNIPMIFMLQAIVLKPYVPTFALITFLTGGALHLLLVIWFTWRFLFTVPVAEMRASWLIVYVGPVAFSIASPLFGMQALGNIVCWASLIVASVLVVLLIIHYLKFTEAEPLRPLVCVLVAPASICLVGFCQCNTDLPVQIPIALVTIAWVIFLCIVPCALRLLKLPFYPSFAAMTFPFVISASAGRRFLLFAEQQGMQLPTFCSWLAHAQLMVAVSFTIYVFIHYIVLLYRLAAQS